MPTFKTSSAKENILRKIRTALNDQKVPMPYPEIGKPDFHTLYEFPADQDVTAVFATEFTKAGGKFIYNANAQELITNLQALCGNLDLHQVACAHKELFTFLIQNQVSQIRDLDIKNDSFDACITDCEVAIARTGSFIFSSKQNFGRTAPIYYPIHIVVLQPHQVVRDISDGLKLMKQKYQQHLPSMINLNTGPSRTADIEKTLVTGVHGPKQIYCFWLES